MHAFDDEVSYTRIIDPEPAGDDLVIPAKGERPSLVWRPPWARIRPTSSPGA
jgi:hypothetical protein